MRKKPKDSLEFHKDSQGQLLDPYTGEPLVPVEELHKAVEQASKINLSEIAEKTDSWLAKHEIPYYQRKVCKNLLDNIEAEYIEKEVEGILKKDPIKRGGKDLRVARRKSHTGGKLPICFHKEEVPYLLQLLKLPDPSSLPLKTDEWLAGYERPLSSRKAVVAIVDEIFAEYEQKETDEKLERDPIIIKNGCVIRVQRMRPFGSICLHRDNLDTIYKLAFPPARTNEWVLRKNVPGAYTVPAMRDLLDGIYAEFECKEQKGTLKEQPIVRNERILRVERRGGKKSSSMCIYKDDVPFLCDIINPFPKKTDDWLAKHEIPHCERKKLKKLIDEIHAEYEQAECISFEEPPITRGNQIIRVQRMKSYSGRPICIHKDNVPILHQLAFTVPKKTDDWLSGAEMADITGRDRGSMERLYKKFSDAWNKKVDGQQTLEAEWWCIPIDFGSIRDNQGNEHFYLHKNCAPILLKKLKTKEWLGQKDMAAKTGRASQSLKPIYEGLAEAWKNRSPNQTHIELRGFIIPIEYTDVRAPETGGDVFCLHENSVPILAKKEKTEDWMGITDVVKKKNPVDILIARKIYKAFEEKWNARRPGETHIDVGSVAIPVNHIDYCYSRNSGAIFCLHKNELPTINRLIKSKPVFDSEPDHYVATDGGDSPAPNELLAHSKTELRIHKTSPTQKIGDADEAKLSEDIKQKLERTRKGQREK